MSRLTNLNGCQVPAERECDICNKVTSIHDLKWHTVHNHPFYLACPSCQRKIDTWKPLPGASKEDRPENVRVKTAKPKQRQVPLRDMRPEQRSEPEPIMELELDTSITLDDLEDIHDE